jgi:uroporphyrinogen-III decarboxylase
VTSEQWEKLLRVLDGEVFEPLPVGFIIDCPWLPAWAGMSTVDYFSSEKMWFEANIEVMQRFPDVFFMPGFWAEYGMCTEPSAFGVKCTWHESQMPFADKIMKDPNGLADTVNSLQKPNPKTDGLLPFVISRLKHYQEQIEKEGHSIKFATSRGPLNVATFLIGSTEFLMAIRTNPDETHKLLGIVTDFIVDWLELQKQTFPSIDGILILDDIVGFLGEQDFKQVAMPYLKRIFQKLQVNVKFFHNDASGLVCAPYLNEIGVNLFNFSFQHTLAQMKELTSNTVTLFGDIPTRDVLAAGTREDVRKSVNKAINSVEDKSRIILSCGGGMPPDVPTENIEEFLSAAGYK